MRVAGVEALKFPGIRLMKLVRFSALRISRRYPSGNIPGTHFYQRLSRPQGPIANIGNSTRDLPTCSAVPQPTAPLRAPPYICSELN